MTHSGGKPHTNIGDRGQRFEVTYFDPYDKRRKVFGWSETEKGARDLAESIELNPSWGDPEVRDRLADGYTVSPDSPTHQPRTMCNKHGWWGEGPCEYCLDNDNE